MKHSPSCVHVLHKTLNFGHFTLLKIKKKKSKPECTDDTAFIASFSRLLSTHDEFAEVSGFKLNSKK